MATQPIESAGLIFSEALGALMAHTIRGVTNHFRKERVDLAVRVMPDNYGLIPLRAPREGTTSIIMSQFIPRRYKTYPDNLDASIFIHKDANKHLARVCIAHEVFHLLLELEAFVAQRNRDIWPEIDNDKVVEDRCNHFAWELCRQHDEFNKNDDLRKKHVLFPKDTFNQPFNMNDTKEWFLRWPDGFALDPQNPFWKQP